MKMFGKIRSLIWPKLPGFKKVFSKNNAAVDDMFLANDYDYDPVVHQLESPTSSETPCFEQCMKCLIDAFFQTAECLCAIILYYTVRI